MRNAIFFIKILSIVFCIGAFSSCTFKNVEFKKIESFKVLKTDDSGALVELNILLKNPNNVPFSLTKADLDVMVNQTAIGKVDLAEKVRVKANSEEVHRFVIHANYSDLAVGGFSSLLSVLFSKKVAVKCKGNIRARAMGISKKFPVEYVGDVPISL